MVVDFSKIDSTESPVLVLKNMSGTPIGVLGYAFNLSPDIKYNEASAIEFSIPSMVDGESVPYYDKVVGMRIIELPEIGQFILVNPTETNSGGKTIKSCKAYSLEFEFTFKKITVEKGTYNFWNPVSPEDSILGIILECMPSWSVGKIDSSLIGKYRTFEVSGENIYNFIKNTLQVSYNCVFDFDTFNRKINVRDASNFVVTNPVFLSSKNLAKEIKLSEDSENIVTQIDVNGADGVNIRDVNPTGTNKIINLDYYMTEDNFAPELIDKYYNWKALCESQRLPYYNLSIDYSLQVMRKVAVEAELTDIKGEVSSVENQQAVIIQSISQGLSGVGQSDLDQINEELAAAKKRYDDKNSEVLTISEHISEVYAELAAITNQLRVESYFSPDERLLLDRYIKEDEVSEASFVATGVESYAEANINNRLTDEEITVSQAIVELIPGYKDKNIYRITGGHIDIGGLGAEIISGACEVSDSGELVMSAYLGNGSITESSFNTACISITGKHSGVSISNEREEEGIVKGTGISISCDSGFLYFTYNTTEYEKRSVAWELYEYGEEVLNKLSQPSYTFSVSSANFLNLEDFILFKNSLRHGEKIYIEIDEDRVLEPIVIGVKYSYEMPQNLTLEFSDNYKSSDSSFRIADLLEKSVSMGKKVDISKFTYSAFIDSGANTRVKEFMTSAIDVAKNEILATKNQAITWGESGIRMRKWSDDTCTQYDPAEIWLNNNSILITRDNWKSAELAIGHFKDDTFGDLFGIAAPSIVGTLVAGGSLIIESAKRDGETAVFRVDGEGCKLHNSELSITNNVTETQIILDALHGIAIGKYPLVQEDGKINKDNCKFWVDDDGNIYFRGTLVEAEGKFIGTMEGTMAATDGYIGSKSNGWRVGESAIFSAREFFDSENAGIYIGTDGISILGGTESDRDYIYLKNDGSFESSNAVIGLRQGSTIGAWHVSDSEMYGYSGGNTVYLSASGVRVVNTSGSYDQSIDWASVVSNSSFTSGSNIMVVEEDASGGEEITLDYDTYYVLGEVEELRVKLAEYQDSLLHRYYFEFTPTNTFSEIRTTPSISWAGDDLLEPGYTYQATITRGIGVLVKAPNP